MFYFNPTYRFSFGDMLLETDPFVVAPVGEGHEHYGLRLFEVWGMSEAEAKAIHDAEVLRQVRAHRDKLIAETDWWVLPDRTPTQEQLDYRQALRDITNTYTSLDDVVWPEKPE